MTRPNGKPILYNAVRYILSNRTYIGEYKHADVVVEHGVPQIIDDDIFNAAQLELQKNAKAPARHTADDDYLLTTKLFCGHCGAMMVAQAGTSHMGNVYRYYACVRQKKHLCDKKMVPKEKLENFVVYRTMGLLKEDSVIDELSARLYDLQYRGSTLIPQLQQQLKDKEREISNIIEAIQSGANSPTLTKRLNELELQKSEIETAIVKEQIRRPTYSQDEYRMALTNYRKIDVTTQDGKRKIIDTFINAIFVYDDHIKIIYNGKNKEECVTLEEIEGSTLFSSGAPNRSNPNPKPVGEGFGFVVSAMNTWRFIVPILRLARRKKLAFCAAFCYNESDRRPIDRCWGRYTREKDSVTAGMYPAGGRALRLCKERHRQTHGGREYEDV